MMRKIFAVAAFIASGHLHAQTSFQVQNDSSYSTNENLPAGNLLNNVVVTANRFPKKQSQTGKVVTLIDETMLRHLQGHTIGEILSTVAGVTVNGANNNAGTNQRLSIRGSSDGNVLLLIDGIPVNDPSVISNYFDLNFISTSQIERIEVLKGGQSTLYGSDAVAGVINIITKKPAYGKTRSSGSVSYGSYRTLNAEASLGGRKQDFEYHASAVAVTSRGFSSAYDSTGAQEFDRDGYHQYTISGGTGWKFSKKISWNTNATYTLYRTGIDAAAFNDDKDFFARNKNMQLGTGIYWRQTTGGLHLNYRFNYVNRYYFDDSTDKGSFAYYSKSDYTGRTHFAELYENYNWEHVQLLAGVDYRRFNTSQFYESVSMFGPFNTELNDSLAKMWQTSAYASVVYNKASANLELGARANHHNVYGNNFTYTFNPSYLVQQKLKLFGNISSAFKTPTLFQLFDQFSGNEDLGPEKSFVFEGGFEWYLTTSMRFRAVVFQRTTKGAIQYIITDPLTFEGHYFNTNRQKNAGLELEWKYADSRWNAFVNYAFTRGRVSSGYSESGDRLPKDTTYHNLYRVPDHAVNAFAAYQLSSKLSVNTFMKFVGKRCEPVYASAPVALPAYFTADLSGDYQVNKNIRAFVELKNVTNTKYFDVLGYNSRRFHFTSGLAWNF